VEKRLGRADYFARIGFTTADITLLFTLATMPVFTPLDLTPYPNICAYLKQTIKKVDLDLTPLLD
jgi:glutathione S-transferase